MKAFFLIFFQNEDEQDENDTAISNMKFDSNERNSENATLKSENNSRPNDLPNLISNHTTAMVSPVNSNSNAWNSDSWADGEFEPLEEPILGNSNR